MIYKELKNESLQGLELYFSTEKGISRVWLKPDNSVVVPDTYITDLVLNLARRRLIKINSI